MKSIETKKYHIKVVDSSSRRNYISGTDAEMDERAVEAVRAALSKAAVCKKPVAKYDATTQKAYVEYPGGRRIDVR